MINEIKYYASKHPELIKCELIVLNAGEDTNKQISDVQDLISRGVDAIVLSPHSNTAFASVLKDAKELSTTFRSPPITITSPRRAGPVVAQVTPALQRMESPDDGMARQSDAEAKGNITCAPRHYRNAGRRLRMGRRQGGPGPEPGHQGLSAAKYANWDYGAAKTAVQNCLANHPEVNGVLSFGDSMTRGRRSVMAAQGYDITKIPMIGVGGGNGPLEVVGSQSEGVQWWSSANIPTSRSTAPLM